MKYIIVAYDKNRVIGANNTMPWQGKMKADMKHFYDATVNNVVIMGLNTHNSIGKPLSNRKNIVISKDPLSIDGVMVVTSIEDAFKAAEQDSTKDIFVIGGGQIFAQTISKVDKILATEINANHDGTVFFPKLSKEWHEVSRSDFYADSDNIYDYSFVTYAKQR